MSKNMNSFVSIDAMPPVHVLGVRKLAFGKLTLPDGHECVTLSRRSLLRAVQDCGARCAQTFAMWLLLSKKAFANHDHGLRLPAGGRSRGFRQSLMPSQSFVAGQRRTGQNSTAPVLDGFERWARAAPDPTPAMPFGPGDNCGLCIRLLSSK
jgi:hypothetical protein